ncbi:Crp/Fnr family transcriptional regulator [Anaerosinus massiliensis]|uniref:Crp/Fnr family transcriptional regulator n=1 Tax=Massilibacillus massiliensis TaxID=1806837 RepID=UPI000DA62DC8|nr:Crp/Fnr family transcriptional regulator [Massilibacillus massiliensis]
MNFAYLRNVPVFEELPPEDLAIINQVTLERKYKKNEAIFREGDAGAGFHYVKTGKIKVIKLAADGREHIINILGPSDIFAEVLLFNQGPYPATAIAMEESCVGMIRNSELEHVIINHPNVAMNIIQAMSKKLLFIQQKVKSLAFSDSYAKVAQAVETLAYRYGKKSDLGMEIDLDFTRQDVANLAGTTRETVSRIFSAMKKEKILDWDERRLIILDLQSLRQYYEI